MSNFVKLYADILTSSLWWGEDSDTRLIWVAMLVLCDAEGKVSATAPGLAGICRVPLPKVQQALEQFQQPDVHSRSQVQEGRRIEKVEGGWRLINYSLYREKVSNRISYYRRYRNAQQRAPQKKKERQKKKEKESAERKMHKQPPPRLLNAVSPRPPPRRLCRWLRRCRLRQREPTQLTMQIDCRSSCLL
jgi:hypothetical protein